MLVYVIIGIIVLGLIVSGKARVLGRGILNLVVTNVAKTPEGAEAVYLEAIDVAQDKYNKSDDHLRLVSGQLDTQKQNLNTVDQRIKALESSCEGLVRSGNVSGAQKLSEERDLKLQERAAYVAAIAKLEPAVIDATEVAAHYEKKLKTLKAEKTTVVTNMKLDKQMSEMYSDMDELRNDSNIDKLLSSVKDGSRENREKAVGAKTVHESKSSTQVARIEAEARKNQSNDYIESLKKKYNK